MATHGDAPLSPETKARLVKQRALDLGFARAGITDLSPAPQIGLWTFGERPTKRVDVTPNPSSVLEAMKKLGYEEPAHPGAAAAS